jgi:hypothetical protein
MHGMGLQTHTAFTVTGLRFYYVLLEGLLGASCVRGLYLPIFSISDNPALFLPEVADSTEQRVMPAKMGK